MRQTIITPRDSGYLHLATRFGRGVQLDVENFASLREAQAWCYAHKATSIKFEHEQASLPLRLCVTLGLLDEEPRPLADLLEALTECETAHIGPPRRDRTAPLPDDQLAEALLQLKRIVVRLRKEKFVEIDNFRADTSLWEVRRTAAGAAFLRQFA